MEHVKVALDEEPVMEHEDDRPAKGPDERPELCVRLILQSPNGDEDLLEIVLL